MSTPAPTTPDQTPRKATTLNRSFTLPSKLSNPKKPNEPPTIGATEGVETLYTHPNVKVLKFTAGSESRPGTSASSPGGQPESATLPWATSREQTVAAGPLEIYTIPGSVSFLRSGDFLHAILPRSQCWCVDGVSKFAMRVLINTYYRIELPGATPEDLEKVEGLKATLQKVLHYERTVCPFARTFTVDIPDAPEVKKRRRKAHGPAKRWKLEKAYSWKPDGWEEPPMEEDEYEDGDSGSTTASDDDEDSELQHDTPGEDSEVAEQLKKLSVKPPARPTVRDRVRDFSSRRSVTAPVQMPPQSTPPSRLRTNTLAESVVEDRDSELPSGAMQQERAESRTFQAIPTDMPPSPPDSSAGFDTLDPDVQTGIAAVLPSVASPAKLPRPDSTLTETVTAVAESVAARERKPTEPTSQDLEAEAQQIQDQSLPISQPASVSNSTGPSTPQRRRQTPENSVSSAETMPSRESVEVSTHKDAGAEPNVKPSSEDADPFAQIQARIQARRSIGGANSPSLTPSSTSLTSTRPALSHRNSQHQQAAFTSALVHKACAVFLGPPAHLVRIMLRIAARFTNGNLARKFLFDSPAGESARVPGSFRLNGSDVEDLSSDDDDVEEDDFGVPLRSPIRLAARAEAMSRTTSDPALESVRERHGWTGDDGTID